MISDQTCLAEGLMKIARNAAIMIGKFESSSNNYDESNLNRLHSVPGARPVAGTSLRHTDELRRIAVRPLIRS
jgi:hypothetical protein